MQSQDIQKKTKQHIHLCFCHCGINVQQTKSIHSNCHTEAAFPSFWNKQCSSWIHSHPHGNLVLFTIGTGVLENWCWGSKPGYSFSFFQAFRDNFFFSLIPTDNLSNNEIINRSYSKNDYVYIKTQFLFLLAKQPITLL